MMPLVVTFRKSGKFAQYWPFRIIDAIYLSSNAQISRVWYTQKGCGVKPRKICPLGTVISFWCSSSTASAAVTKKTQGAAGFSFGELGIYWIFC
jgi:hypothetical protein